VHQVLNPGSIVTEKRQRYTVARGEHLVALLEEPIAAASAAVKMAFARLKQRAHVIQRRH
jgi:hypothetical protein